MRITSDHQLVAERFSCYQDIIFGWQDFVASCSTPLPVTIWINELRTTPEILVAWLEELGFEVKRRDVIRGCYEVANAEGLGRCIPYKMGLFHIQELVSILPADLLATFSINCVIDLCAAPGNKSARLAHLLSDSASVIANDISHQRLRVLQRLVERLGLTNICVTNHNASNFPNQTINVDAVLADVPCSCEGTVRKQPSILHSLPTIKDSVLPQVQLAILTRAMRLVRPGGVVVYATCTFAPEENEVVVDQALSKHNGEFVLLPIEMPALNVRPGLLQWGDDLFHREMNKCIRVWPHENDTGGFFVALLQRQGSDAD